MGYNFSKSFTHTQLSLCKRLADMPAKDLYHQTVKNALIRDQWTITHDPLTLKLGKKDFYVDLGASQLLAAEKTDRKIAVEIKSFSGRSDIDDLEKALGQYILYQDILAELEPWRELYLAIPNSVVDDLFDEPIGKLLLKNRRLKLLSFNPKQEVIQQWITPS
jgi:XisH protein